MAAYIEREALIALLKEDMEFCDSELGDSPFSKGAQTGLNAGINYATVLPAADVVEVKRGRWETIMVAPARELVRWSHVHQECGYLYTDLRTQGHNFCPNCGADMREVREDG